MSIQTRECGLPLAYKILFLIVWCQYTIVTYIVQVIRRLPLIGGIYEYVVPVTIVALIAILLPWFSRKISIMHYAFYAVGTLVFLTTMLFFSAQNKYMTDNAWSFFALALPMLFLGACYDHAEMKKTLFFASLVGTAVSFAYQLYQLSSGVEAVEGGNMYTSYNVLPSIMYLIYWALENGKLVNWLFAIFGILCSASYGTRGALLACIIYLIIGLAVKAFRQKKLAPKALVILFLIATVYFFTGDTAINVAIKLSKIFSNIGLSTRIFDVFIEGDIALSVGRERIFADIVNAIKESPIIGYGMMGDRPIAGSYSHNLFLEMWCSYGILLGSLFSLILVLLPLCAIKKSHSGSERMFILMLFVMVFTKLMVSGTYITEANLFLLIGISCTAIRKN